VPDDTSFAQLSAQEARVLSLTAKGYSYDEVAGLMEISRHTVQTYVKRLYRKLQVNSKLEALDEARRLRLISS
jgi:DNA-binding CsgD family transcriptional regulator